MIKKSKDRVFLDTGKYSALIEGEDVVNITSIYDFSGKANRDILFKGTLNSLLWTLKNGVNAERNEQAQSYEERFEG